MKIRTMTIAALALLAGTTLALAATKDDAVAMVKKAVTLIKAEGPDKAYTEISKGGPFVDGEVYPIVQDFAGITLAQAVNPKLIGKHMIDVQDVDGKYFVKERVDLAQKQASFWTEYKFANPVTKKIQMKDMYCERLNQTLVCAGIYRP
jgi:signal transduction histidine kinase